MKKGLLKLFSSSFELIHTVVSCAHTVVVYVEGGGGGGTPDKHGALKVVFQ